MPQSPSLTRRPAWNCVGGGGRQMAARGAVTPLHGDDTAPPRDARRPTDSRRGRRSIRLHYSR